MTNTGISRVRIKGNIVALVLAVTILYCHSSPFYSNWIEMISLCMCISELPCLTTDDYIPLLVSLNDTSEQ